jgi:hypothetical protein
MWNPSRREGVVGVAVCCVWRVVAINAAHTSCLVYVAIYQKKTAETKTHQTTEGEHSAMPLSHYGGSLLTLHLCSLPPSLHICIRHRT